MLLQQRSKKEAEEGKGVLWEFHVLSTFHLSLFSLSLIAATFTTCHLTLLASACAVDGLQGQG